MNAITQEPRSEDFAARLARVRAAGVLRIDLTESDPARCGVGWDAGELAALLDAGGSLADGAAPGALTAAREAVASYLAGHRVSVPPDRIFFAPSRPAARRLALVAVCAEGDEVLVPAPAGALLAPEEGAPPKLRPYALRFEEEWRLDQRSLRPAVGPRTRAIVVGNPAEPTGALLAGDELATLDELCGLRGLALVGDEAFLDTAAGASTSVARATRCLSLQVSGLSGVCGLPQLGAEWIAVAGPDAVAAPAAARLRSLTEAQVAPAARAGLGVVPALLARREPYLEALRARLARNRGLIAAASLREAPWTLQWGGGSCWTVLQINPVRDDRELCLELLDEGVAVGPGSLYGFPPSGHLVVSLLLEPSVLLAGLDRVERHLRRAE